jgi:hypothetical protein
LPGYGANRGHSPAKAVVSLKSSADNDFHAASCCQHIGG